MTTNNTQTKAKNLTIFNKLELCVILILSMFDKEVDFMGFIDWLSDENRRLRKPSNSCLFSLNDGMLNITMKYNNEKTQIIVVKLYALNARNESKE